MRTCHFCGNEVPGRERVGFREDCERCARPLHTCMNCQRWDATSALCREPMAELVRDPERANLCDWFTFAEGERGDPDAVDAARSAAEKLFKI